MELALRHLETLLERVTTPEDWSEAEWDALPEQWEAAVASVLSLLQQSSSICSTDRARVESVIARLPEVQAILTRMRSQVAQRLMQENQRFSNVAKGVQGLKHRRVSRLLDQKA